MSRKTVPTFQGWSNREKKMLPVAKVEYDWEELGGQQHLKAVMAILINGEWVAYNADRPFIEMIEEGAAS